MDNFEFETKKKKKLKKQPIYVLVCIICLAVGTIGGYTFSSFTNKTEKSEESDDFLRVESIINENFVDTVDSQYSLKTRMLAGMVAGLGDIHTSYLTSEGFQNLTTSINGSFEGIGVSFFTTDNFAVVSEVHKGTPADQAGMQDGDFITHIAGTSIAGYTSDKIKSLIQGEKQTEVTLRILRDGKSQDIQVKRNNVETSVSYEIRKLENQNIGYVRITTFGETTASLLETALEDFEKENVKYICLDLRENGGGYLDAAKSILDLFIEKNQVLFSEQTKKKTIEFKATDRKKFKFDKGFLLVNENSASASEVTTAALHDILNYQIIGEKTYGKGIVQTQSVLSDASVLKYTQAKWLTPKGICVNGEGIEPDYKVSMPSIDVSLMIKGDQTYKFDTVSNEIAGMQKMLEAIGYKIDRTDGYFSKGTEDILKEFEKKYSLKVDGILDKNDSMILASAYAYQIEQVNKDIQYLKIEDLIK